MSNPEVYGITTMIKPDKVLDALLVISSQSGDEKAFELLVKRWNKRLCVQAFSYTHDWDVAKDLTQETWKTILVKLNTLRDSNSFGSWALTIVSRKAMDNIKKVSKYHQHPSAEFWENQKTEVIDTDDNQAQIALVLKLLRRLPMEQRMVLKLFYLEDYSLKEIGGITNVSTNTVKTRLFRGREKIKLIVKNLKNEK